MTTTYELYTNENGTPKAVEGKAPAILERVEALEETLDNGVVTSVNSQTGDVTVDVGVTSVNGNTGDITPEQTGCLPFGGGAMTSINAMSRNVSTSFLCLLGGTEHGDGAQLDLCGKDHPSLSGQFLLHAKNDSVDNSLIGTLDGSLTWVGKEVERVNSSGTNWIRYESGLQIVRGTLTVKSGSLSGAFTFPVAFSTVEGLAFATTYLGTSPAVSNVVARSTTAITINISSLTGKYDWARSVTVLAIGRWK